MCLCGMCNVGMYVRVCRVYGICVCAVWVFIRGVCSVRGCVACVVWVCVACVVFVMCVECVCVVWFEYVYVCV